MNPLLFATFPVFIVGLNVFGAGLMRRVGVSYGYWFPATFAGYAAFAGLASATFSTREILFAAAFAAVLDGVIATSVAWSQGWVPEFEDRRALIRGIALGVPWVVPMMTAVAYCGIVFASVFRTTGGTL